MLRDVAAKRRHVEGSPTFSNASFRSHVRYIMDVMIAAFTIDARHCVPKPREHRSYVHLHTDRAFFISPSKGMPVCKRKSMHSGGCAKVFRGVSRAITLSESEHGPLVTDIPLLRTPLLSKPYISPRITPDYDLLEANMTYYKDMKSW